MKRILILLCSAFLVLFANAQKLSYTDLEREDSRNMNFDIVGKMGDNIVVYKNRMSDNFFSIYDMTMKRKDRVKLTNLPNKIINADFVAYPTFFYMIYQYQKRNIIYCEAIKFNADGKKMEETIVLDTTSIPMFQNDNKIYSVQVSDNKQKIAVIKANKRNDRNHILGIVLFTNELKKEYKRFYHIDMDGRNNFLDEFVLDNEGDIFLAKCYSVNGNEFVSKFDVLRLPFASEALEKYPVNAEEKTLDEIIFKVDNANKKLIIQSFYYTKRRGNIDGIFVSFFDKKKNTLSKSTLTKFSDSIRIEAKGITTQKMAFNDFFIRQVYPKKDGGFIVTAESYYTTSRSSNNMWNRWDYFNASPYITSYDYYNMGLRDWYWNSWDRNSGSVTYNAENIAVFSIDATGNLDWSNVVHKNQRDDASEYFVSFQVLLTGGQLHFLFNEKDRSNDLMFDNSITPAGQLTRHPTLKNLDRQYQIMPRFGKQITSKEMIFPCVHKNYICFAKLEF